MMKSLLFDFILLFYFYLFSLWKLPVCIQDNSTLGVSSAAQSVTLKFHMPAVGSDLGNDEYVSMSVCVVRASHTAGMLGLSVDICLHSFSLSTKAQTDLCAHAHILIPESIFR